MVADPGTSVARHHAHRAVELRDRLGEHVLALPGAEAADVGGHERVGAAARAARGPPPRPGGCGHPGQPVGEQARLRRAAELLEHGARDAGQRVGAQQPPAHQRPEHRACGARSRARGSATGGPSAWPDSTTEVFECTSAAPARAPAGRARAGRGGWRGSPAPTRSPAAPQHRQGVRHHLGPRLLQPLGERAPRRAARTPRASAAGSSPRTIASSWRSDPYRSAELCRMRTVRVRPAPRRAP